MKIQLNVKLVAVYMGDSSKNKKKIYTIPEQQADKGYWQTVL